MNLRPDKWLIDLHSLSAAGLSDRRIAALLSQRYPPLRFTRASVWYWRNQERRLSRRPRPLPPTWRSDRSREQAALHQISSGWGHLLPRELRWPQKGFGPGIHLRPRESDILSLLRDHGSQTGHEVRRALGLTCRTNRTSWLARLLRLGLVELRGYASTAPHRFQPVYALADSARADPRPRLETGVEKRYG